MSSDDLSAITPVDDDIVTRLHEEVDSIKVDVQVLRDAAEEIERLRSVVEAAIVWSQCERAMHGNTAEESRRHYEAVLTAKRRLHEHLDELLVEGAAGRGAP